MLTQLANIDQLAELLEGRPGIARTMVGIAGAPGSGKSTFTEQLLARLNAASPGRAALVEMDGFHFDNTLLEKLGRLERKGAPDTFDADGLRHTLMRLRANIDDAVCVPVFDRAIETARAGARLIPRSASIVLVEGNYLLLNTAPWAGIADNFDITVMVEESEDELRRRLVARWKRYGLDEDEIRRKVEGNDMPNGTIVRERSIPADFTIRA